VGCLGSLRLGQDRVDLLLRRVGVALDLEVHDDEWPSLETWLCVALGVGRLDLLHVG
jgi:hypothetical protein